MVISKHTTQTKIPRQKRTIKPWITPGLLKCTRHRDKLHTQSKRAPDNLILKLTYKRYRNFCNDLLRKLKISYERSELEKASNKPKLLWKTIKEITNTTKICASPVELLKIRNNPKSSVDEVCSFFSNVGKKLADRIISQNHTLSPRSNH